MERFPLKSYDLKTDERMEFTPITLSSSLPAVLPPPVPTFQQPQEKMRQRVLATEAQKQTPLQEEGAFIDKVSRAFLRAQCL